MSHESKEDQVKNQVDNKQPFNNSQSNQSANGQQDMSYSYGNLKCNMIMWGKW